ncbi:unnamed protein product [Gadus morhua 'NCC']
MRPATDPAETQLPLPDTEPFLSQTLFEPCSHGRRYDTEARAASLRLIQLAGEEGRRRGGGWTETGPAGPLTSGYVSGCAGRSAAAGQRWGARMTPAIGL